MPETKIKPALNLNMQLAKTSAEMFNLFVGVARLSTFDLKFKRIEVKQLDSAPHHPSPP